MKKHGMTLVLALVALGGVSGMASAAPRNLQDYQSYQAPRGDGLVFSRHNTRCDYPNGFNSVDLTQSINGTPRGGDELLAEGCGTY